MRGLAASGALLLALLLGGPVCAQTQAPAAEAASTSPDKSVIADLVAANRILSDQQVLDAYGHVSIRSPSNPQHFLMGRNLAPALVTADDIVEYDLDGNPIRPRPGFTHFLERFIHAEIYRARADVNAVVHSHSPAVIPFADTQVRLRPMYHVSAFLYPDVPVFDIRAVAGGPTNMLVGNSRLGKALADTLGANNVVLMRGHGDVVVAPTLPLLVFRAVYTDVNARMQAQAMALGSPIHFLDADEAVEASKVIDQIHTRAWDLWKRKLHE
ncbi:MAG TPA: class II aldolase/adducin family protein [Xanthobacteraceae bacterium]